MGKIFPQESQAPDTYGKAWSSEDLPLVEEVQSSKYFKNWDLHMCMGLMGMHFQDLRKLAHVIVRFILESSCQSGTFRAMNVVYFGFNKTFSSQMQREMQVLHVGSD